MNQSVHDHKLWRAEVARCKTIVTACSGHQGVTFTDSRCTALTRGYAPAANRHTATSCRSPLLSPEATAIRYQLHGLEDAKTQSIYVSSSNTLATHPGV